MYTKVSSTKDQLSMKQTYISLPKWYLKTSPLIYPLQKEKGVQKAKKILKTKKGKLRLSLLMRIGAEVIGH